jgi:hypothetical protein
VRLRRTTGAAAILAAVAVGQVVTSRVPVLGSDDPPFVETGDVGQAVHLSYADVEVTDVRPAHYLAPPISTELVRMAGGVWVLVSVTATATEEPVVLHTAWLVDDEGRSYRSSTRSECAPTVELPTGLPTYALFCFDVPPDRLAGLHFRLARGELDTETDADDLADVDLAVSGGDAKSWATTSASYAAESYSLEPLELHTITITETGP